MNPGAKYLVISGFNFMGPDSLWGDARDDFGVSPIGGIQRNPNYFLIVENPAVP